ncbi:MAG: LamG domain-containing protein, partial [Candidatus Geothermincolia bacterium]
MTLNVAALATPPPAHPAPKGLSAQQFHYNYYFAEGTTRSGFREYLTLANESEEDGSVEVVYLFPSKQGFIKTYPITAGSRRTINVNAEVGPDQDVSLIARSDTPFVAERPMYFDFSGYNGGHDITGLSAPRTRYFFPEGTTRAGYEEWLCLANPSPEDVTVSGVFVTASGGTPSNRQIVIPPWSRETVGVSGIVGPDKDVSAMLVGDRPFVAERAQYYNTGVYCGGDVSSGLAEPAQSLSFAEGTTRAGYTEWLSLFNPNSDVANVSVQYMFADGNGKVTEHTVPPLTRYTVSVAAECGPEKDVSCFLTSDAPIVGERPVYFSVGGRNGGHLGVGAANSSRAFFFAEGTTRQGYSEYLCIQNPDANPSKTRIEYLLGDGRTISQDLTLPPRSRTTLDVALTIGLGQDHGTSICAEKPVLVERPIYFNDGLTDGGDISSGLCSTGPSSMEIDPASAVLKPNEKVEFTAKVKDDSGFSVPAPVEFVSQGDIGVVTGNTLKANTSGTGNIVASAWGLAASSKITVGDGVAAAAPGPLEATILTPTADQYLKQTVQITGTASGENFLRYNVGFYPVGNPGKQRTIKTARVEVTAGVLANWNTRGARDGNYVVTLDAYDRAGGRKSASVQVRVDNTKPSAAIASPKKNTDVKGQVPVIGTASDLNIDSYNLAVNTDAMGLLCHFDGSAADSVGSAQPTLAADVQYQPGKWNECASLQSSSRLAYSTEGHVDPDLGTVEMWVKPDWQAGDNTEKVLLATTPPSGQSGNRLKLSVKDDLLVFAIADGSAAIRSVAYPLGANDLLPGEWSHVAATWEKGRINIFLNGRPATTPVRVNTGTGTISRLGDSMTVGYSGAADCAQMSADELVVYLKERTPAEILAAATASSQPVVSEYQTLAQASGTSITASTLATWDTVNSPEGTAYLRLIVTDKAGTVSTANSAVTVDNLAPAVAIDTPAEAASIWGSFDISGTAYDASLVSWSLQYQKDTRPGRWQAILLNAKDWVLGGKLATWDTAGLAKGEYTIRLTAKDASGVIATVLRQVTLDDSPPTAAITSPDEGQLISGVTAVTGTATAGEFQSYTLAGRPSGLKFLSHFDGSVANSIPGDTSSLTGPAYYEPVKIGQGLALPSTSDLSYPTQAVLNPQRGTVELWAKTHWLAEENSQHILFMTEPKTDEAGNMTDFLALLGQYSGGKYIVGFYVVGDQNPGGAFAEVPAADLSNGRVLHLAASWGGGKLKLYIDGREAASADFDDAFLPSSISPGFDIGGGDIPGQGRVGSDASIDEFSIWDNVRSANQIAADSSSASPFGDFAIAGPVANQVVNGTLANWDTGLVADGAYDLTLVATQVGGQAASAVRKAIVNNQPPTALIASPAQGSFVDGSVAVRGTASDALFTRYDLDYAPVDSPASKTSIASGTERSMVDETLGTWDTASLEDGLYVLSLSVTDQGNRQTVVTAVIQVDNKKPVAQITSPENNASVGGMTSVEGTASDDFFKTYSLILKSRGTSFGCHFDGQLEDITGGPPGSSSSTQSRQGKFGQGLYLSSSDYTTFTNRSAINPEAGSFEAWVIPDWTGMETATHELMSAQSPGGAMILSAGNGSVQFAVWGPSINRSCVRTLSNGEIQAGSPFHVAATWNAQGVQVYVNGVAGACQGWGAMVPLSGIENFSIGGRPQYSAGLEGVIDEASFVDYARSAQEVKKDAGATSPRQFIRVVDGATTPVTGGTLGAFDASALPNGDYTLQLVASDQADNTSTDSVTLFASAANPTAVIITPSENAVCSGSIPISGTATNDPFDCYWLDWGSGGYPPAWQQLGPVHNEPVLNGLLETWDATALPDGPYTLRLHVSGDWTESIETRHVVLDSTAPDAAITAPSSNDLQAGVVDVTGTASDANLLSFSLSSQSGIVPPGQTGGWTEFASGTANVVGGVLGSWDTTQLADGIYTLRLQVTDKGGRISEAIICVGVNNAPPTAVISDPVEGQTVGVSQAVKGTAADAWFESYRLLSAPGWGSHPQAEWAQFAASSTQVQSGTIGSWDTSQLAAGPHTLRLEVVETGGRTSV